VILAAKLVLYVISACGFLRMLTSYTYIQGEFHVGGIKSGVFYIATFLVVPIITFVIAWNI
jgi:hypothetical protein